MYIKTTRKPGQKGTEQLVRQYGNRLICVRYRYDPLAGKRYKTAEIIVSESDWQPEHDWTQSEPAPAQEPKQTTPWVAIKLQYHERELQRQIKSIGGHWNPKHKLWYAPEWHIRQIGLADRIVRK